MGVIQQGRLHVGRKNRRKRVRTVLQVVVLAVLAGLLITTLYTLNPYREPDRTAWTNRDGFIALSYFGVGQYDAGERIGKARLAAQLAVLQQAGYETISQQDVQDFYTAGKALPDKALFLAFEDGRNDSALFAEPLLKQLDYRATMMSYAGTFGRSQGKFLQPRDLKKMEASGYWEIGSSGYRLSYLNAIDEQGRFLGMREPDAFPEQRTAQYYTHYLMDFIRDEHGIPVETKEEMEQRITKDYEQMQALYTEEWGEVPPVYMIMHANSLYNGMHSLVETVNDRQIEDLFRLHFNREGQAFNNSKADPMNLTRVQAAPYWETNHLLMQLWKDTGVAEEFVVGDEAQAASWALEQGAAEFSGEQIALTSPPGEAGLLRLAASLGADDIQMSLRFTGHASGEQAVRLRYLTDGQDAPQGEIRFVLREGEFAVEQWVDDQQQNILAVRPHDANSLGRNEAAVQISWVDNLLDVSVDGDVVLQQHAIDEQGIVQRDLWLSAQADLRDVRWNAYDEQDSIYDAVFEALEVRALTSGTEAAGDVLFSNRLAGWQKWKQAAGKTYQNASEWVFAVF